MIKLLLLYGKIISIFIVFSLIEFLLNKRFDWKERAINFIGLTVFLGLGNFIVLKISPLIPQTIFRYSEIDNNIIYVILFLLLTDIIYYWYHRAQHSYIFLWNIHRFHHSAESLDITTSHRSHFLEPPIQYLCIRLIVFLILGVSYSESVYFVIDFFVLFFLYLGHIDIKFPKSFIDKIFVTPNVHKIHHSIDQDHHHKNFAQIFSFIDVIFKTFLNPKKIKSIRFGVSGYFTTKKKFKTMIWPISIFIKD